MSGGARRHASIAALQALAVLLGACSNVSSNLLPAESATSTSFASYEAVETAYDKVVPGATDATALAQLGFDQANAPNFERISYLSIMARFMPDPAIRFENLPPQIQTCINAQDHCSALIFHPAHFHSQRTGGIVSDFLGFERVTDETGWSAEVIFLMQDQTVVYKVMQGKPRAQAKEDLVQPLGPLTNLGNAVVRAGKTFGGKL